MAKAYNIDPERVLRDMSYANIMLYCAVLPSYDFDKDDKDKKQREKAINADDPKNKSEVHKIMFG